MATATASVPTTGWELAAENIAVKIRWFGLLVGYVLVNLAVADESRRAILNAILTLGAVYALLDTACSLRGRVFLGRYPLLISFMEALFISLLCYFHEGLESPFRYYYLLSLICCAVRHVSGVTYATFGLHCVSYAGLYLALPPEERGIAALVLTLVILGWVTWASDALTMLLKRVGNYLGQLNAALRENQSLLEARIAERTRELHEAQAHVLQQEKMAAFGLLAAGIAHEVGNPLTSISSMVQMLQRRDCDDYTRERLTLVSGQLQRIQLTLRELTQFSRPTSTERMRVAIHDIVAEALNIAKYYKRTRNLTITSSLAPDLPVLHGVRDQLVQVFLNLVLNAVDATPRGGHIELTAEHAAEELAIAVRDNGHGIPPEHHGRIFQPYFTTKRRGTGLGLFVTRKLVTDHGGTVTFDSRPGQGTVFWVRLPLRQTESARGSS